jgi:hypothetical protein
VELAVCTWFAAVAVFEKPGLKRAIPPRLAGKVATDTTIVPVLILARAALPGRPPNGYFAIQDLQMSPSPVSPDGVYLFARRGHLIGTI